jgi:hypothetical protein
MSKITIFENINETKRPYYVFVESALDRIRCGKSKVLVEKIRGASDKTVRDNLKMNLPSVCFSGVFSERKKEKVVSHSGIICLDFDGVENIGLKIETLKADDCIYSCWLSPSGQGVKALVKIPAVIDKHEMYFDALKETYPDIDMKCRDISRVCYESYDPYIYVNTTAKIFDKVVEKESYDYSQRTPLIPITAQDAIMLRIEKWMSNSGESFSEGNRNNYILKEAWAFNRYGISEFTAME